MRFVIAIFRMDVAVFHFNDPFEQSVKYFVYPVPTMQRPEASR